MIALSRIVHGGEGGELTIFEPGDDIKGLPEATMASLKADNLVASKEKAYLLRPELFKEAPKAEAGPPPEEKPPVRKVTATKSQE